MFSAYHAAAPREHASLERTLNLSPWIAPLILVAPAALTGQATQHAPVHTAPAPSAPGRTFQPRDVAGRYEHTDPGSGRTWTLVLEPDGTGTALVNGQPARDSAGQLVTFRYRVSGSALYLWSLHSPKEDLFGSLSSGTLTTVDGLRYAKR